MFQCYLCVCVLTSSLSGWFCWRISDVSRTCSHLFLRVSWGHTKFAIISYLTCRDVCVVHRADVLVPPFRLMQSERELIASDSAHRRFACFRKPIWRTSVTAVDFYAPRPMHGWRLWIPVLAFLSFLFIFRRTRFGPRHWIIQNVFGGMVIGWTSIFSRSSSLGLAGINGKENISFCPDGERYCGPCETPRPIEKSRLG